MAVGRSIWVWLGGGLMLVFATGAAVYFAQDSAHAGPDDLLPARLPVSAAQPTSKRDDVFPDPELQPVQDKRMARYDKNRNNVVELLEFTASRQKAFEKLDRNGDGRLDFEEYALKTTQKFDSADANHNGRLEPAEFALTAKPRAKKKVECPPEDGKTEDSKSED